MLGREVDGVIEKRACGSLKEGKGLAKGKLVFSRRPQGETAISTPELLAGELRKRGKGEGFFPELGVSRGWGSSQGGCRKSFPQEIRGVERATACAGKVCYGVSGRKCGPHPPLRRPHLPGVDYTSRQPLRAAAAAAAREGGGGGVRGGGGGARRARAPGTVALAGLELEH